MREGYSETGGKLIVEIMAVLHGVDILIQGLGGKLLYVAQNALPPPHVGQVAPPPLDNAAVVLLPSVRAEMWVVTEGVPDFSFKPFLWDILVV